MTGPRSLFTQLLRVPISPILKCFSSLELILIFFRVLLHLIPKSWERTFQYFYGKMYIFSFFFGSRQHLTTLPHPPCQQTSAFDHPYPPLYWLNKWMVPIQENLICNFLYVNAYVVSSNIPTLILFYKQHMIKETSWSFLDFIQSLLIFVA